MYRTTVPVPYMTRELAKDLESTYGILLSKVEETPDAVSAYLVAKRHLNRTLPAQECIMEGALLVVEEEPREKDRRCHYVWREDAKWMVNVPVFD